MTVKELTETFDGNIINVVDHDGCELFSCPAHSAILDAIGTRVIKSWRCKMSSSKSAIILTLEKEVDIDDRPETT